MDRVENLIHDNGTRYKGTYLYSVQRHFVLGTKALISTLSFGLARCAICGIFTPSESKARLGNIFGMSLEFELGINHVSWFQKNFQVWNWGFNFMKGFRLQWTCFRVWSIFMQSFRRNIQGFDYISEQSIEILNHARLSSAVRSSDVFQVLSLFSALGRWMCLSVKM